MSPEDWTTELEQEREVIHGGEDMIKLDEKNQYSCAPINLLARSTGRIPRNFRRLFMLKLQNTRTDFEPFCPIMKGVAAFHYL